MYGKSFREKVLEVVARIPRGKTMTYKEVAHRAGANAPRAVGTIMKGNHDKKIPCHRVIRTDGKVGDYNGGGPAMKIKKLRAEGVSI